MLRTGVKNNNMFYKFKGVLSLFLISFTILSFGNLFAFSGYVKVAEASASFNNNPSDFETFRVSNYTRYPDSTSDWKLEETADAGDVVSFTVYYHNTSSETAKNVKIKIAVPDEHGTEIVGRGTISSSNTSSVSGTAKVTVSSEQKLTYIPGSAKWYPNQLQSPVDFPLGQSGDEVVTSSGVNLLNVAPGWHTQGSVVARFKVSDFSEEPDEPSVDIKANNSDGPLILNPKEAFTLSWISNDVFDCSVSNSEDNTEVSVSQNGLIGPVNFGDAYYPVSGESRTFTITCKDAVKETVSDSVVVEAPNLPPETPVLFAETGDECGGVVELRWNLVSGAEGYKIYRDGAKIAETGVDTTSFRDTVASGSTHEYKIKAHNSSGYSNYSNTVSVDASAACPTPPEAPTITAETSNSCGGKIDISWNYVSGADSYRIFRDNNFLVEVSATTTSFTDLGLAPGSIHSYKVKAYNNVGHSPYSNSATAEASDSCVTRPEKPNITVQTGDVCGGAIAISWDLISNAEGYKIYRDGTKIVEVNSDTNFYKDEGLIPGSTHEYRVKAFNSEGNSDYSESKSANASGECPVPPVSTVISASTGGECGGNILVTWTASAGATGYKVFRDDVQVSTTTDLSFTDSGLEAGSSHDYYVIAFNYLGDSPKSNTVSTTASENCALPPTVSLNADPLQITLGDSSELDWTSTNADNCEATWAGSVGTQGTDTVSPDETTEYSITCKSDGGEATASVTVTVVAPPCITPVINSAQNVGAKVGDMFNYSTTVHASTTAPVVYSVLDDLPGGLTFDTQTGEISGVPQDSGTFTVRVKAHNGCGFDKIHLTISIKPTGGGNKGSIMVCKLIANSKGQIATSSALLPTGQFSLWISDDISSGTTSAQKMSFSAENFNPNYNLLGNQTAECQTISDLSLGDYYYSTENIENGANLWAEPKYNDQNNIDADSLDDIFFYSPELFDNDTGNDNQRDTNADGHIVLSSSRPNRTLVVLNTYSAQSTTTAPTVSLSADPSLINIGESSTLSWTSTNANSCSALWTSATSTDGTVSVSPVSTTEYAITCLGDGGSANATTTITVNTGGGNSPTVSINANPSTINKGSSSTITWNSINTISCSAPWTTATSTSGTFDVSPDSTTNYGITCTGAGGSASATTTVTVNTGGGGGGGGSSRTPGQFIGGIIAGATTCDYLKDYMRIDWDNDPIEVIKLQAFLRQFEGFDSLQITGNFDQATFNAVSVFQEKYRDDILTPWGHTGSTGFVHLLTKKKVNEIYCQKEFPLDDQQREEIVLFHQFLELLKDKNQNFKITATDGAIESSTVNSENISMASGQIDNEATSTTVSFDSVTKNLPTQEDLVTSYLDNDGGNGLPDSNDVEYTNLSDKNVVGGVAAAVFSGPENLKELLAAFILLVILLWFIYEVSHWVLERRHRLNPLTTNAMRERKIVYSLIGLIIALLASFVFSYYVLVLPLIILIIILAAALIWFTLKNKENRTLMTINPKKEEF